MVRMASRAVEADPAKRAQARRGQRGDHRARRAAVRLRHRRGVRRAAVRQEGLRRPVQLPAGTGHQPAAGRSGGRGACRGAGGGQDRPAPRRADHGGRVHRRRAAGGVHPHLSPAARRAGHHRPGRRVRVDDRAAVHRRDRAAASPRRPGQPQPARDHRGHPQFLPDRLRALRHRQLAADVRPRRDPGGGCCSSACCSSRRARTG